MIIGVSGHRDLVLEDLEAIRQKVNSVLADIETQSGNTRPVLVSALAEGADQLVATLAIERGWQVLAVLPMPLPDFLEDFSPGAVREQFLDLLHKCAGVEEMSWVNQLDADISTPRDQQYRNQGLEIVRRSQSVIALWDGKPSDSGGCGTAFVVEICKGHIPVAVKGFSMERPPRLIEIRIRRMKSRE